MKKQLIAVVTCLSLAAVTCVNGAIDIDTGRQLFVDDCLVEYTNGVVRHWNRPRRRA